MIGNRNNSIKIGLLFFLLGWVIPGSFVCASGDISITGTVKNAATKKPVPGSEIKLDGTNISAFANEDGTFSLKVPDLKGVLIFSASGYCPEEIALRGETRFDILLYEDVFKSPYGKSENILGHLVNKTHLLSPESKVRDFEPSTALSPEDVIQSQVSATRVITRSGSSGMGSNMFIRGFNSLNANAQPLYVVDGIPWNSRLGMETVNGGYLSNPLSFIDVKDIENITVIKDGTTLYGTKGGNGVIMIKTRRAVDQVTKISFDAWWGLTQKPKTLPVMNGTQFRTYLSDIKEGIYSGTALQDVNVGKLMDNEDIFNDDPTSLNYKKYHNDLDWNDQVYKTAFSHSYAIGITGGDDVALYSFGMGYTGVDGTVKNTNMDRINARFNADIKLSKKVTIGTNIYYSYIDRNLRNNEMSLTSPTFLSYLKAPVFTYYKYTLAGNPSVNLEDVDDLGLSNPVALIEKAVGKNTRYRFNIDADLKWNIIRNLNFRTIFSYALDKEKERYFRPMKNVAPEIINEVRADNVVKSRHEQELSVYNTTSLNYLLNVNMHHIDLSAGFRYQYNHNEMEYAEGYNTGDDKVQNLTSNMSGRKVRGADDTYSWISFYASAGYDYCKKYFLTVNASVDGSSRFGKHTKDGFHMSGNSWAVFPSVEAGWLISSEDFMRHADWIDLLKLRIGYGLSGNDDIGTFSSRTYFNSVYYPGPNENVTGVVLANLENDALQWETSTKANIGADLSFLHNRISLSADVYKNRIKNLLTLKSLPSISGLKYYWSNEGEMQNTGFEISVNGKALNLKNVKWDLGISVSKYKNKIISLPDGEYTTSVLNGDILTAVGKPLGVFYGYKTEGILRTREEAEAIGLKQVEKTGNISYFKAGDVHFMDRDKNNIIDENDKQVIGDPNPDFFGNIRSRLTYKNFTLDALFTYSYGNDVYNALRAQLESGSGLYNQSVAMVNRWRGEGQNTDVPRAVYGDPMGNARFSDRWIEDGSYLRLKTLSLSYKIPVKSAYISGITVWTSANNLVTFTKYLGSDPESSMSYLPIYQGIDAGLLPQSRSFYLGIKLDL